MKKPKPCNDGLKHLGIPNTNPMNHWRTVSKAQCARPCAVKVIEYKPTFMLVTIQSIKWTQFALLSILKEDMFEWK